MRILNNKKKIFQIFFFTKFKFSKPTQTDFLLYDQGAYFNKIVSKYLKKYKVSILYCRFEQLNIYLILNIFLKLKFLNGLSLFQNYIIEYCRLTKPKVIISRTLWDERILVLKEHINYDLKIMLVQVIPLKDEYFNCLRSKKYKIDYFFYFENKSLKIIKKYFLAKFLKIGSFMSNNEIIKKNNIKNKNIIIISGFKKNFVTKNPKTEYEFNVNHEKNLIKILSQISIKKHKFNVLLKPDVNKKDYLKFMKCNKKIVITNKGNPYKIIDKFDLVITLNEGTMGNEALSRGIKLISIYRTRINYSKKFYIFNNKINYEKLKKFVNF